MSNNTENVRKIMIVDIVNAKPGIKGTKLVVEFVAALNENNKDPTDVAVDDSYKKPIDLISALVEDGSLVEVEYILPTMDYRVKSLYFPQGTKVTVVNKGQT